MVHAPGRFYPGSNPLPANILGQIRLPPITAVILIWGHLTGSGSSRAWVNPFTGFYPGSNPNPANHSGHTHTGTSHRVLVNISDLNTTLNAGATYFAESESVTPLESSWCQANPTQCNMYNNVSYRQFSVTGASNFSFSAVAATVRMHPAIQAWTGASFQQFKPAPGVDGIGIVGYKVTNPSSGVWHYERSEER